MLSVGKLIRHPALAAQLRSCSSKVEDVKGFSEKVVTVPQEPVGPGASKSGEYKNPEYFSYNQGSYFEAEVEMKNFRLPQPSSRK